MASCQFMSCVHLFVPASAVVRLSAAEEEVKRNSKAVMTEVASANKELRSTTEEAKKAELVRSWWACFSEQLAKEKEWMDGWMGGQRATCCCLVLRRLKTRERHAAVWDLVENTCEVRWIQRAHINVEISAGAWRFVDLMDAHFL